MSFQTTFFRLAVTLATMGVITGCLNPVGPGAGPGNEADGSGPAEVTVTSVISGTGSVLLEWDDPADADLASIEITWTPDGSTVQSISPGVESYTATGLINGQSYEFIIRAVYADGTEASGVARTATPTASQVLYVSPTGDDGTADGTTSAPYGTVNAALADATAGVEIRVAAGTYDESISLVDGVALRGGYDPTSWSRDIELHETTLQNSFGSNVVKASNVGADTVLEGFTIQSIPGDGPYRYTVQLNPGASPLIAKNNILGGSEDGDIAHHALTLANGEASPIVRDNYIVASTDATTSKADAIYFVNDHTGFALFENNVIEAGPMQEESFTINGRDSYGTIVFRNNTIRTGAGNGSWKSIGAYIWSPGSEWTFENNRFELTDNPGGADVYGFYSSTPTPDLVIRAIGNTFVDLGSSERKYAAWIAADTVEFRNNLVVSGTAGAGFTGLEIPGTATGGSASIDNNTFVAAGVEPFTGLEISADGSDGTYMIRNNLFSSTATLAAGTGITLATTVSAFLHNSVHGFPTLITVLESEVEASEINDASILTGGAPGTAAGNLSVDPSFADVGGTDPGVPDYALSNLSPAAVRTGGADLSSHFTTDITGAARSGQWSIGAYEYD